MAVGYAVVLWPITVVDEVCEIALDTVFLPVDLMCLFLKEPWGFYAVMDLAYDEFERESLEVDSYRSKTLAKGLIGLGFEIV